MFFYIQTKNPPPVRGIFYRRVRRLTAGENSPAGKAGSFPLTANQAF